MSSESDYLDKVLVWARLAGELRVVVQPGLHLRPSGSGLRLVDLDPARPQLDRGKIASERDARAQLLKLMAEPRTNEPGRLTPEKSLQSWLIAEAYRSGGVLRSLSDDLTFVTDELAFMLDSGKIVCDLLALRNDNIPVVIELKHERAMTRLVALLNTAAEAVDTHRDQFSALYSAIFRRPVRLSSRCERWLVWPGTQHALDPREAELAQRGIVVKAYSVKEHGYIIC